MKTYQYRIYPTKEQGQRLVQRMWCCRFVYNKWLNARQKEYESGGKPSYYTLANQLKDWKKEYDWLWDCYSQSLQQSLKNLDTAFKNFFRKQSSYPRFKSKQKTNSVIFPQHTSISDGNIKLPKLWLVRCKFHRECRGKVKRMSVKRTPTGKRFVSITTDFIVEWYGGEGTVAMDVGIKEFGVCSDSQVIPNPKFLRRWLWKLRREQRRLSRKKKGSSNYRKQRLQVARVYGKISNQRKDFLHKTSTAIAKQYDTIVLENLKVANMIRNRRLAQAISDVWWRTFRIMCEYKMKTKIVPPMFTSQTCSSCGNKKSDLKLSDRIYKCDGCWLEIDRDYNASLNLLALANS